MFLKVFVVGLPLLSSSLTDSLLLPAYELSWCIKMLLHETQLTHQTLLEYFQTFLLHYKHVSHKTESWHVDLNFFPLQLLQESTNYPYTKHSCLETWYIGEKGSHYNFPPF